jgi:hypothetical protein
MNCHDRRRAASLSRRRPSDRQPCELCEIAPSTKAIIATRADGSVASMHALCQPCYDELTASRPDLFANMKELNPDAPLVEAIRQIQVEVANNGGQKKDAMADAPASIPVADGAGDGGDNSCQPFLLSPAEGKTPFLSEHAYNKA